MDEFSCQVKGLYSFLMKLPWLAELLHNNANYLIWNNSHSSRV